MRIQTMIFTQPIGDFALSVMKITDILKISVINRREFDVISLDSKGGPQREASTKRVNDIAAYSETPDATFPTPILLALPENSYEIEDGVITLDDNKEIASIVDGQHRVLGLAKSKYIEEYVIPVVFILDATEEQKALIFAIINGKQTRVSASMIYDLFSVVEGRNPYKTAHEIARSLNSNPKSPFYRRLKMLGKKTKGSSESLSQGTFVAQLLRHITNDPDDDFNKARLEQKMIRREGCVFNEYYFNDKDEVIVRILLNLFSSLKDVFPIEWGDTDNFILTKTTGYTGVMKALPEMINIGKSKKELSYDFFFSVFSSLKTELEREELRLISSDFPPSSSGETKLRNYIQAACQNAFKR